ncbi:hypothetical protein BH10CYA1_BH10CYA1_17740 [soil metagenome]
MRRFRVVATKVCRKKGLVYPSPFFLFSSFHAPLCTFLYFFDICSPVLTPLYSIFFGRVTLGIEVETDGF